MIEKLAARGLFLLWDSTLKSVVLLLAAGIGLLLMRRASAAARHLLCLLVLGSLLLLPLLSIALPGWQTPFWPRVPSLPRSRATHPRVQPPTPALNLERIGLGNAPVSPLSVSASPESAASPTAEAPQARTLAATTTPAPPTPSTARLPWRLCLDAVWLAGALLLLAQALAGSRRLRQVERHCKCIGEGLLTTLAMQAAEELGLRRLPALVIAPAGLGVVPMTWGYRRPIVLLPAEAQGWSLKRLRVVLLHEMTHVRRGDWLAQRIAYATCALYWFHPLVWLLSRQMRLESERACDDRVLLAGVKARDYAHHLLDVVRSMKAAHPALRTTVAMAQRSQIEQRLRAIMAARSDRRGATRFMLATALIAVGALLLPLAAVHPMTRPTTRSPQKAVHRDSRSAERGDEPSGGLAAPQTASDGRALRARRHRGAVRLEDALVSAAKAGDVHRIGPLLAQGVNVNANDRFGNTALTEAAYYNRTETVRYLLDRGADINATSNSGWTALAKAVKNGSSSAAEILLHRGAYANAVRKQLQARYAQMAAAYRTRNTRTYAAVLSPDYEGTALDGSTQTRPQAIGEWSRLIAAGTCLSAGFQIDRLNVTGKDATARGHAQFVFQAAREEAAGTPHSVTLVGAFEDSWTQTSAGWHLKAHHGALVNAENRRLTLPMLAAFHNAVLTGIAQFSPRDPVFAVLAHDGSIWIFDTTGRLRRKLSLPGEQMTALAYAPNGQQLMAGTHSGKILLWDLRTGTPRVVFEKPGEEAARVAWMAGTDHCILGVQIDDKSAQNQPAGFVFSLTTGKELWSFSAAMRPDFQGLAVSPDGRQIGTLNAPDQTNSTTVLDAEQGARLATLREVQSEHGPLSIAFAPDSNLMATGCAPCDIVLWDRRKQTIVRVLKGHQNWVVSLAFSPDGKMLVSGAGDGTARVWDVRTGRELGRILFNPENSLYVLSVGFSPDGKQVLAVTDGGNVLIAKAPRLP